MTEKFFKRHLLRPPTWSKNAYSLLVVIVPASASVTSLSTPTRGFLVDIGAAGAVGIGRFSCLSVDWKLGFIGFLRTAVAACSWFAEREVCDRRVPERGERTRCVGRDGEGRGTLSGVTLPHDQESTAK